MKKNILHNIIAFCCCLCIILQYCQFFVCGRCYCQFLVVCQMLWHHFWPLFVVLVTDVLSQWWWPYLWLMLCHCGRWNPTGYDWCCCHFQWTEPFLHMFFIFVYLVLKWSICVFIHYNCFHGDFYIKSCCMFVLNFTLTLSLSFRLYTSSLRYNTIYN